MAQEIQDLSFTIAVLKVVSTESTSVFQHPHNARYSIKTATATEISRHYRDSTPPVKFREARLRLSLREREKPFNPQDGFVFGSGIDNERVDIMRHHIPGGAGVSRRHFSINFNCADKSLIVKNFSRLGTTVESSVGEKGTCTE